MKLTRKDAVATLLFAAVMVPYVGYLIRGEMPFIQDPRGMAAVGVVALALSLLVWGGRTVLARALLVAGVAVLGLGFAAALIGAEGSGVLLAFFIGAIGVMWAVETMADAGAFDRFTRRAPVR